jgi:hypothetical protein
MLGLAMVTVTPGRTPPVASETFPLIDPVVALTCAQAGARNPGANRMTTNATILFIAPPLGELQAKVPAVRRSAE